MTKTEFYFPSSNGINQLHGVKWVPEGEVKSILQLSHGMVEYINRYNQFGTYLAERGILVVGHDHLGHGKSVKNDEELGYFEAEDGSETVVNDLYEMTKKMKAEYPGVPYFVLGHSMGSFMIRRYIMTYGKEVDGCIIMGTGNQPKFIVSLGKKIVSVLTKLKGERHRSNLMDKLSFGAYNKEFKPVRTKYDWLSRDTEIVDAYSKDKYCTFLFTMNGYKTLFETFSFIMDNKNIDKIPKDLPLFFVAGDKDPVGQNGVTVTNIFNQYVEAGIKNAKLKLYKGARHEILNEINRKEVFEDIYEWINSILENM